jgi:hypothetical protein
MMIPILSALCGCAGSVIFGHTIGGSPPATASTHTSTQFKTATISFSPHGEEEVNADPRFDREVLTAAITSELRARQLLVDNAAAPTIEIVIDQFAVQPASNAVLLGYVLSNSTLQGSVAVHDVAGQELRRFDVKAEAPLAASAGGKQAQPLAPLYQRFADLTASTLVGAPARTASPELPR